MPIELSRYGLKHHIKETMLDPLQDVYWQVVLSNQQHIIQTDGDGSSWIKLAACLEDNPKVGIVKFGVHFRDNSYYTPDAQWAYYFSKGILQAAHASEAVHYYVMGWQTPATDTVECLWIKIPELIPINHYQKTLKECYGPALILCPSDLTILPAQL